MMRLFFCSSFYGGVAWILYLLHLAPSSVLGSATVTGCNGYPCSIGSAETLPITNQSNAEILARCHVYCLNTYAVEDYILAKAREGNVKWPAVSIESILDRRGCETVDELISCRYGCFARIKVKGSTRRACRMDYEKECSNLCPGLRCPIPKLPRCALSCNREGFNTGCATKFNLPESDPPVNPTYVLSLVGKLTPRPQGPGKFLLGSYPIPRSTHSEPNLPLTTFIVRVEYNLQYYYYIQERISSAEIDLSKFGCKTVNISFAVANKDKVSNFSTVRSFCIHGATRYPKLQPHSLRYKVHLDNRTGFEKNVVIRLSWKKPEESHLAETYRFVMNTSLQHCASQESSVTSVISTFEGIGGNLKSFMLDASTKKGLPKINCKYNCSIELFPSRDPDFQNITIDTSLATFVPQILLECSYFIDDHTGVGSMEAMWHLEVTEDTQIIAKSIANYTLKYEDNWTTGPNRSSLLFESDHNISRIYEYRWSNIHPSSERDIWIKLSVTPHLDPYSRYDYLPLRKACTVPLPPPAPSAISTFSIEVSHFNMSSGKVALRMIWSPPAKTYGNITNYQIRILNLPASSNDAILRSNQVGITSPNMTLQSGQMIEEAVKITEDTTCLFVQLRARNIHLWGSWSDSIPLMLYPVMSPNCSALTFRSQPSKNAAALAATLVTSSVIALVFFFVAVGLTICLCRRHHMKMQMTRAFDSGFSNQLFLAGRRNRFNNDNSLRSPLDLFQVQETDEWEIPVGAVIVEAKFGEGCFGEVHRGVVRGPLPGTRSMKTNICVAVAIKMLKPSATGSERSDFLNEIETMKKVAQGNNPHVITFIGCATLQEPLCLITEFVKYGDLLSYLETMRKLVTHKNRQRRMARIIADMSREPEPYLVPKLQQQRQLDKLPVSAVAAVAASSTRASGFGKDVLGDQVLPKAGSRYADLGGVEPISLISFAYQIATGMEYLTSIDIVHRDLACRNILIGEDKTLKISDFGMSRVVTGEDIYVKTSKGRLPWKWMATESIINREFTHASDVWAYGVTLWEIATLGGFPYPTVSNSDLLEYLKRGYRLECPENCSPEIYQVMMDCWHALPGNRKTFTELRSLFDALLGEDNPYIQFENINAHKSYYNVSSRRNTRCEEEFEAQQSSSEGEFEVSRGSSTTLNGNSAFGSGYNNHAPLLAPETPPTRMEDHQHECSANMLTNEYVETPTTFDCLIDSDEDTVSIRSSSIEVQIPILSKDEIMSSGEIDMELNAAANSTHVAE